MKAVFALLYGVCLGLYPSILSASPTQDNLPQANIPESLGMKLDSSAREFAFEMGKSPLDGVNMLQYFGVILILVGLLVFLWYVKTRLNAPQIKSSKTGVFNALFDNKDSPNAVQVQSITTLGLNSKLIVFEAYHKRYLVIVSPNGTKLIDSYHLEAELQRNQAQELFKELLEQELPSETK